MVVNETIIDEILTRGVIKVILPSAGEFKKLLLSGKQLRFYIGVDPTGNSLHLSHAKNFLLLEEFRKLGHKVFVLFGDLTACIGDPSERSSARTSLSRDKARENAKSWVSQIRSIINFDDEDNPAEIKFNSTWFDEFTTTKLLELFANSTVQQLLERDMFQKRISDNKPIFLNEFLYPMFQGYDSVALDVDVELCGTDQIFNALSGRDLIKKYSEKDKYVVAVNLMENPKTGQLMSKSNNTGVFLGTGPTNLFGQIMAQPDEMIEIILINNTRVPLQYIKDLDISNNPMKAKLFAATEVTKLFYGEDVATVEYDNFINIFSKKNFSASDVPTLNIGTNSISLITLIARCLPNESKSSLKRLISQGAVSINSSKLCNEDEIIEIPMNDDLKIKVGKRNFFKIRM